MFKWQKINKLRVLLIQLKQKSGTNVNNLLRDFYFF